MQQPDPFDPNTFALHDLLKRAIIFDWNCVFHTGIRLNDGPNKIAFLHVVAARAMPGGKLSNEMFTEWARFLNLVCSPATCKTADLAGKVVDRRPHRFFGEMNRIIDEVQTFAKNRSARKRSLSSPAKPTGGAKKMPGTPTDKLTPAARLQLEEARSVLNSMDTEESVGMVSKEVLRRLFLLCYEINAR